jgi:hypothetical protein
VGVFVTEYVAILNEAKLSGYDLPSESYLITQNDLIIELKTNGVWSSLDALWWFKGDGDGDFKKINWLDPTGNKASLLNANPVTFDVNGYQSQNRDNRLDLPVIWNNLTVRSACAIGEVVTPLTGGNGIADDGSYTHWFKNENTSHYLNGVSSDGVSADFTGKGVFALQTIPNGASNADLQAYKNGTLLNTKEDRLLTSTINAANLRSNYGAGVYSDVKLGFLAYGAGINQTDFYGALPKNIYTDTLELTYTAEEVTVN